MKNNNFEPKLKVMRGFLKFVTCNSVAAITLCPFGIYFKLKYITRQRTITHEKIHWQQQLEMLVIFFYLWYFVEWLIRLITNKGNAYRSISFEREAYSNDSNKDYLKVRKSFSWLKYLTASVA